MEPLKTRDTSQRKLTEFSEYISNVQPAMEQENPTGVRHINEVEVIESELIEAHRRSIQNESRLHLMKNLLEKGLCTRDIYSFACTQADLCVTTADLDISTVKCAMKMKIRDLVQTIKNNHRHLA